MRRVSSQADSVSMFSLQELKASRINLRNVLPEMTKALIWLLGIALLISLTVKDFQPLLDDYFDNNVATQVEVVASQETFKQPQMVLFIPHYKEEKKDNETLMKISRHIFDGTESDCSECVELSRLEWDVWKRLTSKFDNVDTLYNSLSLAFVRQLLISIETDNDDPLDDKHSLWNQPLVTAALNFFIWYAELDEYMKAPDLGLDLSLSDAVGNRTSKFDLLFNRLLKALCYRMTFQMWNDDSWTKMESSLTCRDFLLDAKALVAVDKDGLYFPLPDGAFVEHWFTFFLPDDPENTSMWTPTSTSSGKGFALYADTAIQYVSIFDTNQYTLYQVPDAKIEKGIISQLTVTYSVHVRARETRPDKLRFCHNESNPSVCLNKCTKLWTIDHCHCLPFSYRQGLQSTKGHLPYCTEASYSMCNQSSSKERQRDYCSKQCKSACEYTAYNWQISPDYVLNGSNALGLDLIMHPLYNPFVEFTWTTKNTPEQFLSQAGGLLNFYLGLSGLSLFTFVILCIDTLKRFYRCYRAKKKRGKEAKKENDQVSTWEWKRKERSPVAGSADGDTNKQLEMTKQREQEQEMDKKFELLKDDLMVKLKNMQADLKQLKRALASLQK